MSTNAATSNQQGNIFFNRESFVLSLPLITLCTTYAYFKFIPLNIGLPILGGLFLLYKVYSSLRSHAIERKEQKIANLDEDLLKELIADENEEKEKNSKKALRKQRQKDEKLRQRLAAAKKKSQRDADDADEDDDEDISVFAKGKSKKR